MWSRQSYLACRQHIRDGLATDISRYDNVILEATVARRHRLGRSQCDGLCDTDQVFRGVFDTWNFRRIKRLQK